jgi:hypothetical protein
MSDVGVLKDIYQLVMSVAAKTLSKSETEKVSFSLLLLLELFL